MADKNTISKAHLHAYLDGQLNESQRRNVEAYLDNHPGELEEIRQNLLINKNLHELYDPLLQRPIPDTVRVLLRDDKRQHQPSESTDDDIIPAKGSSGLKTFWQGIAAGILLFIGAVIGWMYHEEKGGATTTQFETLTRLAVDAHRIYSQEKRHAVEVTAADTEHLMKWLSTRLKAKVGPADLRNHGFEFMGGRLLPAMGKPAGVYLYENTMQKRLSVYISFKPESSLNTAPACTVTGDFNNVCAWSSGTLSYFVVGNFPVNQMQQISDSVKRQADNNSSLPKQP